MLFLFRNFDHLMMSEYRSIIQKSLLMIILYLKKNRDKSRQNNDKKLEIYFFYHILKFEYNIDKTQFKKNMIDPKVL